MNRFITILMTCLALLLAGGVDAQTNTKKQKIKPEGVNALKYSLQKRHLKKGVPFENRRIWDNFFFSGQLGYQSIGNNGFNRFDAGMQAGFSVGKFFTGVHAARLSFSYANNGRLIGKSLSRFGISADHLYNVSAYLMGYDPNRSLELLTVAGLGTQFAKMGDKSNTAFDLHLGLQMKVRVNSSMDVFLEPQLGIATRNLNFASSQDRAYNLTYGFMTGLRYILRDGGYISTKEDLKLGYSGFWSFSSGIQSQLDGLEGSGIGPSFDIALARWLKPGIGFRVSGTMSMHQWHKADYPADSKKGTPAYRCNEYASHIGVRAEAMFDPILFFRQYDSENPFQVRLLFGGEFGKMAKENNYMPIRKFYSGLTGGLQFGYQIMKNVQLFVEPHFTLANYSIPYEHVEASKKFSDKLMSIQVGLAFEKPLISRKEFNKTFTQFFEPHWFGGIEGGILNTIHSKKFQEKSYMDYQIGAFAGYEFTPLHGVSLGLDASRVSMDMELGYRQFNMFSANLNYRLNILNVLQGFMVDRKLEIYALAGPVMTLRKNAKNVSGGLVDDPYGDYDNVTKSEPIKDNKFAVGGQFGLELSYRHNEHFSFHLKPSIKLYPSDILPSTTVSGWRKFMGVQLGVTYAFFE